MTTTPRLGAPELVSAQATPETTVNEQIRFVEQGASLFIVKDKDLTTPPGSPADGDAYIVGASPTGAWSGWAERVAFYRSSSWESVSPIEGMFAYIQDENELYRYDGADWLQWVPTLGTGDLPTITLNDLSDVDDTGKANGEVLTFDSGSGNWVSAPAPGSGGSSGGTVPNGGSTGQALVKNSPTDQDTGWAAVGWVELLNYDFATGAASTKEVDVTGYKEIMVFGDQLVYNTTAIIRAIQFSVDGGSTWFTTSGDYQDNSTAGVGANNAAIFGHATGAASSRSFAVHILDNDGRNPVIIDCITRSVQQVFRGSATAVNRIRLM